MIYSNDKAQLSGYIFRSPWFHPTQLSARTWFHIYLLDHVPGIPCSFMAPFPHFSGASKLLTRSISWFCLHNPWLSSFRQGPDWDTDIQRNLMSSMGCPEVAGLGSPAIRCWDSDCNYCWILIFWSLWWDLWRHTPKQHRLLLTCSGASHKWNQGTVL